MTYPHGGASEIWRDGDGGAHNPAKSQIRDWGGDVETKVANLEAQAFTADPIYSTSAAGLAASSDGEYFKVANADVSIAYDLYLNSTGSAVFSGSVPAIGDALFTAFIDRHPKMEMVMTYTGGALGGASFWDGAATAAAASAGGIHIPAGQTGHQSYIRYQFPISAAQRALFAGRTVKFIVPIVTSSGLMEAIPAWSYGGGGSPTNGTIANRVMTKITDTLALFSYDYTFIGTETLLNSYFQVNNSSTTFGVDHHWHGGPLGYFLPLDEDGFGDVMDDFLATDRAKQDGIIAADLATKRSIKMVAGSSLTSGVFAGATYADAGDPLQGFTIAAGFTGCDSYYSAVTQMGLARSRSLAGRTVRFSLEVETSADALIQRNFGVNTQIGRVTGTTDPLGTFANVGFVHVTPTRAIVSGDFTFSGVEQSIAVTIQQLSNNTGTGEEVTIKPVQMYYAVLGEDGFDDAVEEVFAPYLSLNQSITPDTKYIDTVTVSPGGGADFTTLRAAIEDSGAGNGVTGAGTDFFRRVKYEVAEGVYTDIEYFMPNFADIVGVGRRDHVWLKGYQAANTTIATISANSTIWMNETTRLHNLSVTAQNMRYPIHSDSSASAKRAVQEIYDCHIEHLGNDEARQWQTDNGGNPAGVWLPEQAWGCGTHSGQKIISRRTNWISGNTRPGFGFHTNRDFTEGNYVELDQCRVASRDGDVAIGMTENGSKTPHELVLKDCQIDGHMTITSAGYLTTSALVDHGNGSGMCNVRVSGCSPFAWTSSQDNNVLEIRGTAGATSAVAVSGTAAAVLFGEIPDVIEGGTNYAARVFSQHKINKLAAHSLAARLGDLTGGALTLTVSVDGAAGVDLTLNADYSADSNATVIAALNSLASGAGVSVTFYESTPYQNEAPVYQLDREVSVQNTSADTVILKGMAVAYDGARHLGRIATNSDARTLISGIALENIAPGRRGRVQKSGQIHKDQVLFSATPSIAFGDEFGLSAAAGQIEEGAATSLLRAVSADVLELAV